MHIQPVTLEGQLVRLEPLSDTHAEGLLAVSQEPFIWRYKPVPLPETVAEMRALIRNALQAQEAGKELPFVILDRTTNAPIGSTRYLNITPQDRGVEIGWTWLTQAARRTGVNTECKYLLLRHAFETLGAIRVQIKTDTRNETSQRAIERLGAVREGILRKHKIMHDGYQRDTVFYSIIDTEWPMIKARLEAKMAGGGSPS